MSCTGFQLDLTAGFGICKCGLKKMDHASSSQGSKSDINRSRIQRRQSKGRAILRSKEHTVEGIDKSIKTCSISDALKEDKQKVKLEQRLRNILDVSEVGLICKIIQRNAAQGEEVGKIMIALSQLAQKKKKEKQEIKSNSPLKDSIRHIKDKKIGNNGADAIAKNWKSNSPLKDSIRHVKDKKIGNAGADAIDKIWNGLVGIKAVQSSKYITVEKFGDQLNANGKSFGKQQRFLIVPHGSKTWSIQAHTKKYLSMDLQINAAATDVGTNEQFEIVYKEGTGVVSFRGSNGNYINNTSSRTLSVGDWNTASYFSLELQVFPQINLKIAHKYVGVREESLILRDTAFGGDLTFILNPAEKIGCYTLTATNGNLVVVNPNNNKLEANGDHKEENDNSVFVMKFAANGSWSFLCIGNGCYVGLDGRNLKAKKKTIGKMEKFEILPSRPQITLKAFNNNFLSIQNKNVEAKGHGVDIENSESYVFLLVPQKGKYAFQTSNGNYLSSKKGGLKTTAATISDSELFVIEFRDKKIAIKSNNGNYITAKKLGSLHSKNEAVEEGSLFDIFYENRQQLVLQNFSSKTYIKANQTGTVKCLSRYPEIFKLEYIDGKYKIKSSMSTYFDVSDSNTIILGVGSYFYLKLVANGQLAISTMEGNYLSADRKTGNLIIGPTEIGENELFRF